MSYPKHLRKLIAVFKRLPGVGTRTAERHAFQLLHWSPQQRNELAQAISAIEENILHCRECGCLSEKEGCHFCSDQRQSAECICVVASPRDACTIEETGTYRGMYHVLEGLLSPVEGIDVSQLRIDPLLDRIKKWGVKEVILALDATLEGDATALFLKEQLSLFSVKISRIAFGLPMGSAFDFIDGNTLARAFQGRNLLT